MTSASPTSPSTTFSSTQISHAVLRVNTQSNLDPLPPSQPMVPSNPDSRAHGTLQTPETPGGHQLKDGSSCTTTSPSKHHPELCISAHDRKPDMQHSNLKQDEADTGTQDVSKLGLNYTMQKIAAIVGLDSILEHLMPKLRGMWKGISDLFLIG
jgi:hypothetical protein